MEAQVFTNPSHMAGLDSTQCCHPSSCCFLVGPVVSPLRIHSQFGSQEKTRREFTSRFEGFPPCRIHLFWDLPPLFSVALAALVSVLKHHKLKGGPSAGVLVTLCRVHWAVSSGKRPQNCGHQPTEFPFQSLTALVAREGLPSDSCFECVLQRLYTQPSPVGGGVVTRHSTLLTLKLCVSFCVKKEGGSLKRNSRDISTKSALDQGSSNLSWEGPEIF